MILKAINRIAFVRRNYLKLGEKWSANKVKPLMDYLPADAKILDLGSGNCMITNHLKKHGYNVTAIDVKNLSIVEDISPIIYDGVHLPFEDNSFDVVLVLTVLHHSDNPAELIREAKRVSQTLVIIEDTFGSKFQKKITQLMDTLVNLGHSKMTYQNKSETEWESLFVEEGLTVLAKSKKKILFFFQQTTYQIRKMVG